MKQIILSCVAFLLLCGYCSAQNMFAETAGKKFPEIKQWVPIEISPSDAKKLKKTGATEYLYDSLTRRWYGFAYYKTVRTYQINRRVAKSEVLFRRAIWTGKESQLSKAKKLEVWDGSQWQLAQPKLLRR